MDDAFYQSLTQTSLSGEALSLRRCHQILTDPDLDLISLAAAAHKVREKFWKNTVRVHILNNIENGGCSENCAYCIQSKNSTGEIDAYPMKPAASIIAGAEAAYKAGAFRYCMVFSGTGPQQERMAQLIDIITEIKRRCPIEVCVSAGFISDADAKQLKEAGANRYNHNINTAEDYYQNICQTHQFSDRIRTIESAHKAGLNICSGVILGMGESDSDVVDMALTLRRLPVASIPINFFLPLPGAPLAKNSERPWEKLTPQYCLRVLCLFRFLNPSAEIRMAAGREMYLRSLQSMGLFVANSLFANGYLNSEGSSVEATFQMIRDAGFVAEQNH